MNNKKFSIKNMVPGTLVYKGASLEAFEIECIEYNKQSVESKIYTSSQEFLDSNSIGDKEGCVRWINIVGISHVEEIRKFGEAFQISNLVMEQVLHISNHSVNQYSEDFIFNDIQKVYTSEENQIVNENTSLFKRSDTVIVFQEKESVVFDDIRRRIMNNEGNLRDRSSGYLYYCVLDSMTDFYLGALNVIGKKIERLEEKLVNMDTLNIQSIHEIKKLLMILKFSAAPIEKMVSTFIEDASILELENPQYLLNLQGHIKEVVSELSLQKGYVDSIFENYVLNNSNDMNSVMTTLTIFSAIFIPLSFAAGVFGMNFEKMPGLDNPNGFIYFIFGCIITAGIMLIFFKKNKWF